MQFKIAGMPFHAQIADNDFASAGDPETCGMRLAHVQDRVNTVRAFNAHGGVAYPQSVVQTVASGGDIQRLPLFDGGIQSGLQRFVVFVLDQ